MKKKTLYLTTLLMIAVLVIGVVIYMSMQPADKKNYVIGIVNPNPGMQGIITGFIDGMACNGYVAGKNIKFVIHESKDDMEGAIKKMVDEKVDMIYALTTPATKMVKKIAGKKGIPVVFTMHDPVNSGIIKSLARPGTNLTGVQLRGSTPKALEWLLALAKETKHIFVPVKYDTKAARQSLADLEVTAAQLGIRLTIAEVNSKKELLTALSSMPADVDAIFVLHSILIFSNIDKIINTAIANRIPIGSGSSLHEYGVTITFGDNSFRVGKQASRLASRILQGKSAADTPAEMAVFYLGINLKTAEASGIEVPNDILLQADYVVR